MNSIMRDRAPQNLIAAQSELLNAEVRVMLNSGVRISEATLRVARDAAQKNPAGLHHNRMVSVSPRQTGAIQGMIAADDLAVVGRALAAA